MAYVKAKLDELSNNDDALLVASDQAVEDLEKEIEASVIPSVRKIHLDAPNILLKDGYPMEKLNHWFDQLDVEGEFHVEPTLLIFPWIGGEKDVFVYDTAGTSWDVVIGDSAPPQLMMNNYMCTVELPNGTNESYGTFLRLITLRMSSWLRPIQTLVGEDSVEYFKQKNKYLRGTPRRPVGALLHGEGWGANGRPVAELYTCSTNMDNISGQYVPEPRKMSSGKDYYVEVCAPLRYPCLNQITACVLRSIGRVQEAMMYEAMAVQPFRIDPEWARLNPVASERINIQ